MPESIDNTVDNHSVTNLRVNVGIDYVYFFDNKDNQRLVSIGYLVDYYADAVGTSIADNSQCNRQCRLTITHL